MPNFTSVVKTHGACWFLKGLADRFVTRATLTCPECKTAINLDKPESNHISFEHPVKDGENYNINCQCLTCGCVFTVTRTEKCIVACNNTES